MIKYFKRFFWQALKGLSQVILIFLIPGIIGADSFTRLDYVMSTSRSFSSFFDGFLSYQYQDAYLKYSIINRSIIFLFYFIGILSILFFAKGFSISNNLVLIIILYTTYYFTDVITKLFDLSGQFLFSSLLRLLLSLFLVFMIILTKSIVAAIFSLLLLPVVSYILLKRGFFEDRLGWYEVKAVIKDYGMLMCYGIFSIFYALIDRTFVFTNVDKGVAETFAYLSRVISLMGFFLGAVTTMIYAEANKIVHFLNTHRNSRFIISIMVILSSIIVFILNKAFENFLGINLSDDVWIILLLYLPVQLFGSILITLSLRHRNKSKHIGEGVLAMTLALIFEWYLFKSGFYIEGIMLKLLTTSLIWTPLLMVGLKIQMRMYYDILLMSITCYLLVSFDIDLISKLGFIIILSILQIALQSIIQIKRSL